MNDLHTVREISRLLRTLATSGIQVPDQEIFSALTRWENGLLTEEAEILQPKPKSPRRKKAAPRPEKDEAAVAKKIDDLASRLRDAFPSDENFEKTVQDVESSGLTKSSVIELYKAVFGGGRSFPKSATKQSLLNAIRKDRIAKVRAAS